MIYNHNYGVSLYVRVKSQPVCMCAPAEKSSQYRGKGKIMNIQVATS